MNEENNERLHLALSELGFTAPVIRGQYGEPNFSIEWDGVENPPTMSEIEAAHKKVVDDLVLEKEALLQRAKDWIGYQIIKHVGTVLDQLNLSDSVSAYELGWDVIGFDPALVPVAKEGLNTRNKIKFVIGIPLKHDIRAASTMAEIEAISALMDSRPEYTDWIEGN